MNLMKFENFKNRGEIRKDADKLLGDLHATLLSNIAYDNRENIKKSVENIKNSYINWDKDVVNSVKEKYKELMKALEWHMNSWD